MKLKQQALIVSVSKTGAITGDKIAQALANAGYEVKHFCRQEYAEAHPTSAPYVGQASEVIKSNYGAVDAIVGVMAVGGLVRILAPLMEGKFEDPAVVVTDDLGKYVVSLLSGHHGGANELAKLTAQSTGGTAVITTATETLGKISLEEISRQLRCRLMNKNAVLAVNAAIINGENLACILVQNSKRPITNIDAGINFITVDTIRAAIQEAQNFSAAIIVSKQTPTAHEATVPTAWLKPLSTVLGIGSVKGIDEKTVIEAINAALSKTELDIKEVESAVTIKDEPGITTACERLGLKLFKIQPQQIAAFKHSELSGTSEMAMKIYGVPGVAEPAALWLAGTDAHLLLRKMVHERKVTVAIAEGAGREDHQISGTLHLVGVGPGSPLYLTHAAEKALSSTQLIAGYSLPLSTIKHLSHGKEIMQFSYKRQEKDLELLAQHLRQGKDVCYVFTGDSCFSESELVEKLRRFAHRFEIIPGISSIQLAAAKSGVPLEESHIVTFHVSGDLEEAKRLLLEGLRRKKRSIIIPRPSDFMPKQIAEYLISNHVPAESPAFVYERLTLPDESVTTATLGTLSRENRSFSDLSVMVIDYACDITKADRKHPRHLGP